MATMEEVLKAALINIGATEAVQELHNKKIMATMDLAISQDKMIKHLLDVVEGLQQEMRKLHDVYYHVFPERMVADIEKLEAQIAADKIAFADALK